MTAAAVKKTEKTEKTPEKAETHPLLRRPIPHAYALVPVEGKPGLFYAVHLENVVAERLDHLEANGRPAMAPHGMIRIHGAMETRHRQKKWGGT